MQPTFSFSPDGQSIYTFTPGAGLLKMFVAMLLSFLICLALALIELGQLAMAFLDFLLTSNTPVLVRFLAFLISILLAWAYMKFRMAKRGVNA